MTWECKLPDGEPYYLHWPRSEFGPSLGIKKEFIPPGGIPVTMLMDFLPTMVGKEFNLVIEQVKMDEPMEQKDGPQLIQEGRWFHEGLYNGTYRPSVKREEE